MPFINKTWIALALGAAMVGAGIGASVALRQSRRAAPASPRQGQNATLSFPPTREPSQEVIIRFTSDPPPPEAITRLKAQGLSYARASTLPGAHVFRLEYGVTDVTDTLVDALEQIPGVAQVERNGYMYALYTPNDTHYPRQWNLAQLNLEPAWDIAQGQGVTVAVVDTGVAYEDYTDTVGSYRRLPDFASTEFIPGYDYVNNDTHPNDDNQHGTFIAGIIAATAGNSYGTAGVAFRARLMPVKVLDGNGRGSNESIASGIRYAADYGARVINLSFGGPDPSPEIEDAVRYAHAKGATIVAASGNSGTATPLYPASYSPYVIAIGAVQFDRTRAPYSNYGPTLDLVAPGGNIMIDQNGDGSPDAILAETIELHNPGTFIFPSFQGTSMATAHVSGVAALIVSLGASNPSLVRQILETTAQDLGPAGKDDAFGYGLVDALQAVRSPAANKREDLNADGIINAQDLGILLSNWGRTDLPAADINKDGRVDASDLGIILSHWTML